MYQTIPTNFSKELNTDTIEILKQLQKQSEDISTSECSNLFLKNLSNPTNLTNPQIIGTQKTPVISTITPTFRKKDIKIIKKRNFNKAKSNINVLKDELFNNNKYTNNLVIKNPKKIEFTNILINDNSEEKGFCNTTKGKVKLKPIWDKLRSPTQIRTRDIRINKRKEALVQKYIDKSKIISQMKYNLNIKKEKYEQMRNITQNQLYMINKTEKKMSQLQNVILNDYNINYIQYLKFLNNTIEKEIQSYNYFYNNIKILKKDIKILNNKIAKLIENKCEIMKWIELFIRLKEKIKTVPKYYLDILEENDYYKVYQLKDKITDNGIVTDFSSLITNNYNDNYESHSQYITQRESNQEKILNYRYNLIFESPEEFMRQFSVLERDWVKNIDILQNNIKEVDKLKKKCSGFDESNFKEDENLLIEKVRINKNIYYQLRKQYENLKDLNKKTIKKIKIDNSTKSKSTLSSPDIYSNIYNEMYNNLNFYTKASQKIKKTKLKELPNVLDTNLYKLIFDLFNLVNQNNFIKFDKENFAKNRSINPIFEIMNFIEEVINLLLEEKQKYLNDPKLKEKYKSIEVEIVKENKKVKLLKLIKLQELKIKTNNKEMKDLGIQRKYLTSRKVDYSLYKKIKKFRSYKSNDKETAKQKDEKAGPKLEDFLYDI